MSSRIKQLPFVEFEPVLRHNWEPRWLEGDAIPRCLFKKGVPLGYYICGSGTGTINYQPGTLIGGIDVYRLSLDDPVPWNKDWYGVWTEDDPSVLRIEGPQKDAEHWLHDIPLRRLRMPAVGASGSAKALAVDYLLKPYFLLKCAKMTTAASSAFPLCQARPLPAVVKGTCLFCGGFQISRILTRRVTYT